MHRQALLLFVFLLSTKEKVVNGEGCSAVTTSGGPVINMCESGTWTLGVVYVAVNTTNMGSSTRCSCTLSGTTQGQNLTTKFTLEANDPTKQDCDKTVIKVEDSKASQEFRCQTTSQLPSVTLFAAERITMTLSRPSPMHLASYCLSVIPNNHSAKNVILMCQGDPSTTTTATPSTTTISSTSSSMPPTSSSTSSMSSSLATTTSAPANTTSTTQSTASTMADRRTMENDPNLTGPIVGGVVGGIAVIVIVIVVVVCARKRKHSKPPSEERPGAVNRGYENVLTDNILYESSSGLANNQSPLSSQPAMSNGEGAYQSLDENGKSPSVTYYNTSGGLATVSTVNEKERPIFGATNDYASVDEVTPRTSGAEPKRTSASPPAATPAPPLAAAAAAAPSSAPPAPAPKPPTDQYAVVSKPPRQNKPAQNAEARSQSTNVTLPSGDVYAVVDRARNRGSEPTSPRSPPPEVAPPPAPAPDTTPGLVYADLDLVPSPRSSVESSAPPTDYAEIDHEASARL